MHLMFFIRGKFEQVELLKAHAQGAYWKWRRMNNETGEEEIILVQGALRQSVFGAYEYIFPKEALTEVCSFFGIVNNDIPSFDVNTKLKQFKGRTKMKFLEKMFGCKPIPKSILKKAKEMPDSFTAEEFERGNSNCVIPGTAIHVLGIKKDKEMISGKYTQEGL